MVARLGQREILFGKVQAIPMTRIIYVPFDQLNREYGALKSADPKTDQIILIESQRMIQGRPWHKQRLFFLISSARHFAVELEQAGFDISYVKASTTVDGIQEFKKQHPDSEVICASPNSFRMRTNLENIGLTFVENDFFLTTEEFFNAWADQQKTFTMENFYRAQRRRLNVLMDGELPIGGQWNFDADNRLAPPKEHDWGSELSFEFDDIDKQVISELPNTAWGALTNKVWGTTRQDALAQLQHFLTNHFAEFGPYEDAMPNSTWRAHHSLLSPYLNNGLLHPNEVIDAALARIESGDVPISSCEGFIRQIIGWREYIRGMYWYFGEDYQFENQLQANRPLLPLFNDPNATKMNCVKSVVSDIYDYGWTHHIPRIMVLSNLALLTGTSPQEFLAWMREVFIDAADWVMIPNVIGMATHADGGKLMTKPYAAGGAYISKMGQFCKGCDYDPKKRVGADACPFTSLYWDFLSRNYEEFRTNHRMFQQLNGLKRLSDVPEVTKRAKGVLASLDAGEI